MNTTPTDTESPTDIEFEVSIGGHGGSSYSAFWNGATLEYSAGDYGMQVASAPFSPSREKWLAFWKAMDRINVWGWEPHYSELVIDGAHWTVRLRHGERLVESGGSNGYPGGGEGLHGDYSKEFKRFLKAVRALLGGREFS